MRKKALLFTALFTLFSRALEQPVQLFFTANRQGEIEPCHCTTNQIGGLSRLHNYLENAKASFKGETFFVDSGDTFFSLPQFPDALKERELSKAKLIASVYKKWKVDYVLFGERDLALGTPALSKILQETGAAFPPPDVSQAVRLLQKGKIKMGLVAALKADSIDKKITELRDKKTDLIVVLSHLGIEEDKKIADRNENILIVGSHSLGGGEAPLFIGKSVIVETKEEGKNIGRAVFSGPMVNDAKYEFVDLDKSFEKDNEISKMLLAHIEKEKKVVVERDHKKKPNTPSNTFVANPFLCKQCHEEQFNFWKDTKHASAYSVLYAKNQHFDPDCISCHVLGFEKAEGFQKISEPLVVTGKTTSKTPFVETIMQTVFASKQEPIDSREQPEKHKKLHEKYLATVEKLIKQKKLQKIYMGVQCEHCHGNRSEHVATVKRGDKTIVPQTCLTCHRAPNAPEFKTSMIPLASCPKMN